MSETPGLSVSHLGGLGDGARRGALRAQDVARLVLRNLDASLAGSAFEPDEAPESWFEDSLVPYPVEFEVTAKGVHYRVEFPPSTIATSLLLVRQAFENHGITIKDWVIDIQEGWS